MKKHLLRKIPALIAFASIVLGSQMASAQQSNLSCSLTPTPFINGGSPSFTVTESHSNTGLSAWSGCALGGDCPARVIDASTSNYATGTIVVGGSLTLSVEDAANNYSRGNFAGFVMGSSLLNLNALGSVTIRTYLDGNLQQSKGSSSLVALNSSIAGAYEVGFYTDTEYDQIELVISSTLGAGSYNVYYAIQRGTGSCPSPQLPCNTPTALNFPTYPAVINPARTGVTGALVLGAITNRDNAVDNSSTTYASINTTVAALGTASFSIKNVVEDYAAGTYAGFDISNPALLTAAVLGNVTIQTYRDDTLREQQSGNGLLLGSTLLASAGRQPVGFVATQAFDEVQLVINQPVGLSLGETRVYGAVLRRFCEGPALVCNTPVTPSENVYPVYLNGPNTGITGAACVACDITATGNVIDGDNNSYAEIALTVGALNTGSIAVRKALAPYAAGTYAGFEIENPALLDVNVLGNVTITTYLNGSQQESIGGSALIAGLPSTLLGGSGRMTLGFVSTLPFDEAKISVNQTVSVNLGTTRVYSFIAQNFCATPLACNSTFWLYSPAQPVVVNSVRTGISGAVCALCSVTNPGNVISASTTDYTQLVNTASLLSSTSISVQNGASDYPAGSIAGFAIQDPNNFLQVSLFKTISLTTYLNGVQQEARAGGQLLNLSAVLPLITTGTGVYNVGFATTLSFDEVRITTTPTVGVIPILNVYGAFIDTRYLDSASSSIACPKPPIARRDNVTTLANSTFSGNVRTNDRDPQGGVLTYNTTPATAPAHGTVNISANGLYTYTPTANYTGLDSFSYTVCNAAALCSTTWVYITVQPAYFPGGPNRAPYAQPDYSTTLAGTAVTGNARSNDTDPDGNQLVYSTSTSPLHGTLSLNTNGTYVYTPDSNYIGMDTARIQICDNGTPSLCTTSQLLINVQPDLNGNANDAPVANDDVVSTSRNLNVSGNVRNNDSDPNGGTLTAVLLDAVPAANGTLFFAADGSFTFAPSATYTGSFMVRYTVCDGGSPSRCDTATLTISVQPAIGPDFTPIITTDNPLFATGGTSRDFVLNINELIGSASNSPVVVKIVKPSAFTITYGANTTSVAVGGTTAVQNSDWTITENAYFITCTLKSTAIISGSGSSKIGFNITRKPNIPANTAQNLTSTIVGASGGDSNTGNNQSTLTITAQ